jgi:AAA ATPase domain
MITRFTIRNFKRLQDATLELGSAAVFIGPNNSGKTTALQALALWDIGWRRWAEKRDESAASERKGVTINRRDLFAIPVPSAKPRTRIEDRAAHPRATRPVSGGDEGDRHLRQRHDDARAGERGVMQ